MIELNELEQRVTERYVAALAERTPVRELPDNPFDMSTWTDVAPLPPGTLQFPREQWASYPTKRTICLTYAGVLLDKAAELTDDQWMFLALLMQYGGKTRLS